MKCKQARQSIALSVGRDLNEISDRELQRHVSACPSCRDHFGHMHQSVGVLQQVSDQSPDSTSEEPSLWPSLSRLLQKPVERDPSPFSWSQSWVPAVAIASIVLAMISVSNSLDRPRPDGHLLPFGTVPEASNASQNILRQQRSALSRHTKPDRTIDRFPNSRNATEN